MSDKAKVEAVLFSVGNRISLEELSRLCRLDEKTTLRLLQQLRDDCNAADSALMVVEEGAHWKLTVREPYLPLVQSIVTETELSKTIMETLAVIAWKAPVLQSDVIKVRTNKAYDHIQQLEEAAFISRQKHGRTMLIKLTDKFYKYFDLSGKEEVREKFKGFGDVKELAQAEHEARNEEMLGQLEVVDELPKVEIVNEPQELEIVDIPEGKAPATAIGKEGRDNKETTSSDKAAAAEKRKKKQQPPP